MPPPAPQPTGHDGGKPLGVASGAITFEALAEIAAGDTARVDLCRILAPHPRAGAMVAVKRLHPHVAEDPTFVKQFLDEVRFTYWLRHPNVVEVAGWGTDAQGSYLAVELVQGVSLLRLMKTIFDTGEAFTERMVVYIASRICRGLVVAHSLRAPNGEMLHLVHRDLTPSNVLVGFNGEVKITDFGMAKAKQRLTKTLTGMRKGEPTYMAPEQARSDEIDARADLFSLGVMLFELFAGRRPWIAKSDYEMVQVTTREPPADLRELRPKIDRELVTVVNRCLEKEPGARYQSAHEIAERLDEWLTVHGYQEDNEEALGRFVRRNAMRQMRWFERAMAGDLAPDHVGRVGRDPHPRVPTYTEHTKPRSEPPPEMPTPSPGAARVSGSRPPGAGSADKPLVPPRPGGAPADPRSIRAANVVQQLKKLAPPVEPARGRQRRAPSLDEDDATDVELRIGPRALPNLVDGSDEGEEDPTLVHKGDAKLQAIRAEARARRAGGEVPKIPRPTSSELIDDDESDLRVTEVTRDDPRAVAARYPGPIADPPSDFPTAPMEKGKPRPPPDPDEAPTPIAPQKAKTTPVNLGAPVDMSRRSRGQRDRAPPVRAIPPSPDIPPRPFPKGNGPGAPTRPGTMGEGQGSPAKSARPTIPGMRAVVAPPPGEARGPSPEHTPVVSFPPDPSRTSHHDDVQVIDRSAFQPQASALTEEALIAEADRLAIEAVRRSEEARAAQLRAERKTASAKLAGEAAMIAADAVRMLRGSGLAAAARRLEEARTLDANLQSGKIPSGEVTASMRPAPAGFSAVSAHASTPVSTPSARPAPPEAPAAVVPSYHPPPMTGPIFAGAAAEPHGPSPGRPSHVPSAPSPAADPRDGPRRAGPMAAPAPSPPIDPEAFRARLRPSLLGTPRGALVALALIGLGVVVVLVALLVK